jgi:hypothetical protein
MENEGGLCVRNLIIDGSQNPDASTIGSPCDEPLSSRDLREKILSVIQDLNDMAFHRNDRIPILSPAGPAAAILIVSGSFDSVCL